MKHKVLGGDGKQSNGPGPCHHHFHLPAPLPGPAHAGCDCLGFVDYTHTVVIPSEFYNHCWMANRLVQTSNLTVVTWLGLVRSMRTVPLSRERWLVQTVLATGEPEARKSLEPWI